MAREAKWKTIVKARMAEREQQVDHLQWQNMQNNAKVEALVAAQTEDESLLRACDESGRDRTKVKPPKGTPKPDADEDTKEPQ